MKNQNVTTYLTQLQTKFESGKYWNHDPLEPNNPESIRTIPCTHNVCNTSTGSCGCNCFARSIQCFAFALYMANKVFGTYPVYENDNQVNGLHCGGGWRKFSKNYISGQTFEPGDIIRTSTHSAIYWKNENEMPKFGEVWGSEGCKIHWGNFNDSLQNTESKIFSDAEYIIKAPKTFRIKSIATGKTLTTNSAGTRAIQLSGSTTVWFTSLTESICTIRAFSDPNNAMKYSASSSGCGLAFVQDNENDACITIENSGSNYKLKLTNHNLYLSADASGSNVYWASGDSTAYQKWSFEEV